MFELSGKQYVVVAAVLALGLISGFFVGRAFPVRHYQKFGSTGTLVIETTTGHVCDAVRRYRKSNEPIDLEKEQLLPLQSPEDVPFCGEPH